MFTSDPAERTLAEASKAEVQKELRAPVDTRVLDASVFWVAEEYHQDFYVKNPDHYKRYRLGCGRDARLETVWGKKAGH